MRRFSNDDKVKLSNNILTRGETEVTLKRTETYIVRAMINSTSPVTLETINEALKEGCAPPLMQSSLPSYLVALRSKLRTLEVYIVSDSDHGLLITTRI